MRGLNPRQIEAFRAVVLTGGVGMAAKPQRWLKPGDVVTIDIEKIGQLTNEVEAE